MIYLELHEHSWRCAPWGLVKVPDRFSMDVVPAASEDCSNRIHATMNEFRHVVSHIKRSAVEARIAWVERVFADPPTIQIQLVVTQAANVESRLLDGPVDCEFTADVGRRVGIRVRSCGNPLTSPQI